MLLAALVQAAAAVVALVVTVWLARVAGETLRANERMAASAERQIAVMHEQMRLEHRPNVVLGKVEWPEGKLEFFNLGRWPVLIYRLDLTVGGQAAVEFVALAAPPGGFATYSVLPDQYMRNNGKRAEGEGTLALEFFHGSTERRRYRLEGVEFQTSAAWNSAHPRVVIRSQGHVVELPGGQE